MLASNIYTLLMTGTLAAGYAVNNEKRGNDDIIIGFRATNKVEARGINENNKLSWDPRFHRDDSPAQLGHGVYMSPVLGEYNPGDKFNWFCVVKASRAGIEAVNKAWIPETDENKFKLWFQPALIGNYLEQFDDHKTQFTLTNTIRMSMIEKTDKMQLMIPENMINDNDSELAKLLNVNAQCYEGKNNIPQQERGDVSYANAPFSLGRSVGDIFPMR